MSDFTERAEAEAERRWETYECASVIESAESERDQLKAAMERVRELWIDHARAVLDALDGTDAGEGGRDEYV